MYATKPEDVSVVTIHILVNNVRLAVSTHIHHYNQPSEHQIFLFYFICTCIIICSFCKLPCASISAFILLELFLICVVQIYQQW